MDRRGVYIQKTTWSIAFFTSCISSLATWAYNELYTLSFTTINLTCYVQDVVNPCNCVYSPGKVLSYLLAFFFCTLSQNHSLWRISFGIVHEVRRCVDNWLSTFWLQCFITVRFKLLLRRQCHVLCYDELIDTVEGLNQGGLDMLLVVTIEYTERCTWRQWWSYFSDRLWGQDPASLEMHLGDMT